MSAGGILGYLFVGGLLAILSWGIWRMRPRRPYLILALGLLGAELLLRAASPVLFPANAPRGLTYEANPVVQGAEDLVWPNRVLIFLLTAMALWLLVRPMREGLLVGAGQALVVAGGWPNLLEPLMRGHTTDYIALGDAFGDIVLNLADVCLVLGLPVLLVGLVRGEIQSGDDRPDQRAPTSCPEPSASHSSSSDPGEPSP